MRRMRIMTKVLSAALSAAFALSGAFGGAMGTALAAENTNTIKVSSDEAPISDDDPSLTGKAYEYTIRVFGGKRGTVDGGTVKTYKVANGEQFDFQQSLVNITDGKYVYRGIRESGRDANEKFQNPSFKVTQDMDLVVVYGVAGTTVSYRVEYVDQNGGELLKPQTFYGNEGDKPIIAYQYVEGFEPNAYNLTGTLSSDKDNVFRFIYTEITAQGSQASTNYEEEATTPGAAEGGAAAGGAAAGGAAAGGAAAGGAAAGGAAAGGAAAGGAAAGAGAAGAGAGAGTGAGAGAGAAGGAAAGAEGGVAVPAGEGGAAAGGEAGGPADVIDIDENQTPLGEYEGENGGAGTGATAGSTQAGTENIENGETPKSGMSTPLKVGIGAGVLAIIALIVAALLRGRLGPGE